MAKIIPNTFQTFNSYVDIAEQHLSGDEFKVLIFATRHILGWQNKIAKRQGRISLSMFENGFTYVDDETGENNIFAGCGLARQAIIDALKPLVEFGLIVREKREDGTDDITDDGQLWSLGEKPNWRLLEGRTEQRREAGRKRTAKARAALENKRGGIVPQTTGLSDNTGIVPQTATGIVPQTATGLSDNTESKPLQSQEENQVLFAPDGAAGETPSSKSKRSKANKASSDRVPSEKMNPMKDAIFAAFDHSDWETLTDSERGVIQKSARELILAGYTPADVKGLYDYCGDNFDTFGPRALCTNASDARAEGYLSTPAPTTASPSASAKSADDGDKLEAARQRSLNRFSHMKGANHGS